MVEEHELRKERIQEDYNDKYWDQRYTIVQQQIPSFLQKVADKILSTGAVHTAGTWPGAAAQLCLESLLQPRPSRGSLRLTLWAS